MRVRYSCYYGCVLWLRLMVMLGSVLWLCVMVVITVRLDERWVIRGRSEGVWSVGLSVVRGALMRSVKK